MKNRNIDHRNDWSTPQKQYEEWDADYEFSDFDPCPINGSQLGIDGLKLPWINRTFVNPPYELKAKNNFVMKGIAEWEERNISTCFLLPVSTSTRLFHGYIIPNASEITFLSGRLSFEGVSENKDGSLVWVNPGTGRRRHPIADVEGLRTVNRRGMHDSMLVFFGDW